MISGIVGKKISVRKAVQFQTRDKACDCLSMCQENYRGKDNDTKFSRLV